MAGKYDYLNYMTEQELADHAEDHAVIKDCQEKIARQTDRMILHKYAVGKRINRAIARARLEEKRKDNGKSKDEGRIDAAKLDHGVETAGA